MCLFLPAFNKSTFAKMKEGSILINTARGAIVDHDALDEALKAGRPMAAGLDVTDPEPLPKTHPLSSNPKCIITPHLGTSTRDTRINMTKEAATNLYITLLGRTDWTLFPFTFTKVAAVVFAFLHSCCWDVWCSELEKVQNSTLSQSVMYILNYNM